MSTYEKGVFSNVRVQTIARIIDGCRFGIHDLSRTTLDSEHRLPRFNMPLELGIFLGAKRYGDARQRRKSCLILERDPYRYQIFCSDIGGQDIWPHGNKVEVAIAGVRDWLRTARKGSAQIPGRASHCRALFDIPARPAKNVQDCGAGSARHHFSRLPYHG